MPKRDAIPARTVLISSRIDELGSSRRAAFRAVHDEGWIPLLYEMEPDEWMAAKRRPTRKEEHDAGKAAKRANERLTMNNLLYTADHFIGVYGTSLGDPSAELSGLRPLEYEILRFLFTHKKGETEKSVANYFLRDSSPDGVARNRERLHEALSETCKKSSEYHAVFRDRMALFLKQPPSDVPASSLMYSTIHKLRGSASGKNVQFFRSCSGNVASVAVVYWRPSSHLYLKIRRQIQDGSGSTTFRSQPARKA